MADDVRAFVQRHTYFDVPMWRVQVFDGDAHLSTDFVLGWEAAIRLANSTVAEIRRRQIKIKRARYSRVGKMRNHRRNLLIHSMRSDGTFASTIMVSILKAYGFFPEELGLTFAFEADREPADG